MRKIQRKMTLMHGLKQCWTVVELWQNSSLCHQRKTPLFMVEEVHVQAQKPYLLNQSHGIKISLLRRRSLQNLLLHVQLTRSQSTQVPLIIF